MSIWHKLVENLLVISAEEERKGYVEPSSRCLPAVPPSYSGGGLLLVPALGRPPEYKCSKAAVAGSLSVCLSVCLRDHVAKGPCLRRERLPPCEESQDTGGGSSSWYALVLI